MRVLLLVHYYFPNIQSCAQVMHDLGAELSKEGHEVVIAAPDDTLKERRSVTRHEGITVLRVRSGRFRDIPRPLRAFNEWRLSATMWNGAKDFFRENPCELIVNYSPTIFFGPLVARLKELWGSTNYLVLRDIFPKWSVDAGVIRSGSLVHRFFRHYERLLYRTADVIGVQSERNLDYFEDEGLQACQRLEVLYNWAPSSRSAVGVTNMRRELGLEDRIVFFYGGNLGVAQDASAIVRLADGMKTDPAAFFLVVGSGSEAARLRREASDLGLDNLRFLPPVDQETYFGLVSEFDVGLITLNRSLETHNFPGKMLDYMYFGKPMLAAVNPGNDLKDLVELHEAGFVCANGEDLDLIERARRLASDPELRRTQGSNSRKMLEEVFAPERAARQILAAV